MKKGKYMKTPKINTFHSIEELTAAFQGETWKIVDHYKVPYQQYAVSDMGRVCNLLTGRILDGWTCGVGYRCVAIRDVSGAVYTPYVHDLVSGAFHGLKPQGSVVRHLNGCPVDNRASNLAYGTPAENQQDAFAQGTHPHAAIRGRDQVMRADALLTAGIPRAAVAAMMGVSYQAVSCLDRGDTYSYITGR